MDKNKIMDLLSEVLDKKADFRIHLSQYHKEANYKPVTRDEAYILSYAFKTALNAPEIKQEIGAAGTKHFLIEEGQFRICIPYIPDEAEMNENKQQRIEQLKRELAALENLEEAQA